MGLNFIDPIQSSPGQPCRSSLLVFNPVESNLVESNPADMTKTNSKTWWEDTFLRHSSGILALGSEVLLVSTCVSWWMIVDVGGIVVVDWAEGEGVETLRAKYQGSWDR